MSIDDVLLGTARGMAIFLFWGLVYVLIGFEPTVVSVLIYSLIIKRKLSHENN